MKSPVSNSLAFIVLALGLTISVASWKVVNDGERETATLRSERAAEEAAAQIRLRMASYEQLLRSAAALFAASDSVERSEWKIFYDSLHVEQNFPGIQGVAWAPRVTAQQRASFEEAARRSGLRNFSIHPPSRDADMVPVFFIEPFRERNLRALGFDMFSQATRREAMERARDHNDMALSGKVQLVQESSLQPQVGTLLYFPVYRRGQVVDTLQQRREALAGYVFCAFRMQDLIQAILGSRASSMQLELFDGISPHEDAVLYRSPVAPPEDRTFQQMKTIQMAGRVWTLRFTPQPDFQAGYDGSRSLLILIGGIAFSLLSFGLLLSLGTVRSRALQLAASFSAAHRDSEARMRAIFDSTADAILSVDMRGTILTANRVAEDMFGHPASELVGASTHKLTPARDHAWIDSIYASLAGTTWPRDYRREMTGLHRDGHTFPVQVSGTEVTIDGVQQLVMLIRDISHQKRAEENLRRSDILREALLNHAPFCIISTDLDGIVTALNPAGERLVGYSAAELIGKQSVLRLSDPQERAWAAARLTEVLGRPVKPDFEALVARASQGLVDEGEWTAIRKDGSRVPVWAGVAAIRDENGEIFGYIGIVHDITERKRVEAALAAAKEQAEAANKAKSEFLANMSHEIRTPMNAVLGMAHLIGTEPLSRQQQTYLQMLNTSGRSLLGILNDILDFSKVEAGRMELSCAPFLLDDVVDSLASLMAVNTAHKDIEVAIHAPPCHLQLYGDALRLQQTLINLADNAIKFTEHGEVVLDISIVAQQSESIRLRFSVRDTGIGMDSEQMARLFQPFSQADNSMTRRYGGTGLGLVISRRIVALLGGEIQLRSEPALGSEFFFELDFVLCQQRSPADALEPERRRLRLLVVGAHPALRRTLQDCASALEWSCHFVHDLADTGCGDCDILICDWPADFDGGLQQVPLWCQRAEEANVPLLIALKGHLRERLLNLPHMQHIAGLLLKPLTRQQLLAALSGASITRTPDNTSDTTGSHSAASLHGMHLLLAEDNTVNQVLARRLLEQVGAMVDIANNGAEAVHCLRHQPQRWHAILMDAQMPVMDGFTATRIIREELQLDLPIIALTAGVLKSERDKCLASGMNDFVPKPLDVKLLYAVLSRYWSGRRDGTDGEAADSHLPE